jgi:hypothetical protein
MITRRTLLKLLLSSALAEAVDVEKLLWVPKPIITVPDMPVYLYDHTGDAIGYMIRMYCDNPRRLGVVSSIT